MQYDLKDEAQAQEYLKNVGVEYRFQCYNEKKADACHRLANFLENIKKDFEKAGKVFKTNCDDLHYGQSCFQYGNYNIIGRAVPTDFKQALKYHLDGCKYGYMPSCHNVGLLYGGGKATEKRDYIKALEFFEHGCDNKNDASCFQISSLYIQGKDGVPKNMEKAFEYAQKACDLGNIRGCVNLSQMYQRGEGVAQDDKLAKKYKEKSTEMHDEMKKLQRPITLNQ